ncbi:RNA 2',3'-cyclic phosphodiesterase [Oxalobacteraceae bacterium OM1]|nr:RNA 2',3'-cyclic phosphodiesterase [Oxalobacteraceae bacterium OM1]
MTANSESMRLFYALWPDDETRAALQRIQQSMSGRLSAYANLHLTLAFLGQQPASALPVLEDILQRLPPLAPTLHVDRVGYFTRNRIAWAGMHDEPVTLHTLHDELAQALAEAGIRYTPDRTFRPHITLARDASLPPDLVFDPITWRADQVVLVRSVTRPEGPIYTVVNARPLDRQLWTSNEAEGNAAGRL